MVAVGIPTRYIGTGRKLLGFNGSTLVMADDAASAEPPAEAPLDPFAAARARALAVGAAAAGSKPNTPPEGGSEDGAEDCGAEEGGPLAAASEPPK